MSTFGDIKTGYERLKGAKNYGLIYTCNCGWLDLGHLNPDNDNKIIGAANLWKQVSGGGPDARISFWYHYPPRWRFHNYSRGTLDKMKNDKIARLPDGRPGFRVRYRQEMGGVGVATGVTRHFLVAHNLSEAEKKSIALSIFIWVSMAFEEYQLSVEWGGIADWLSDNLRGKSYDSGFSREDLVSNLIGFYVGIGDITKDQVISKCHPVSEEAAVAIWNREGPVGEKKNRQFKPILAHTTGFDDEANRMCRDDCIGQPNAFPTELKSITPQTPGKNYIMLWDH